MRPLVCRFLGVCLPHRNLTRAQLHICLALPNISDAQGSVAPPRKFPIDCLCRDLLKGIAETWTHPLAQMGAHVRTRRTQASKSVQNVIHL